MSLRRRRLPWFAGLVLAALVVAAVFAPYLAPHSPTEGDLIKKSIPPIWMEGGNPEHPLGTDRFGRDVLSRIIWGSRISLVVSLVAIGVAGTPGTPLGLVSGDRGGGGAAALLRPTHNRAPRPPIPLPLAVVGGVGPPVHH